MDQITDAVTELTAIFGLLVVLAVATTGFFLGRKWLNKGSSVDVWDEHVTGPERFREHNDEMNKLGL